jgi:hypothetical protein
MSGKFAPQQRAIKLVDRMERVGLHLATGAGKTLVGLGSFAHLADQGKVKRGLFVVPPKQTGQWGSEALSFLTPGRWKHFSGGGATAEQRRQAYADPGTHIVMVGHQALRDDLTWAVAKHYFDGNELAARRALGASRTSKYQDRTARAYTALTAKYPEIKQYGPAEFAAHVGFLADDLEDRGQTRDAELARKLVEGVDRSEVPQSAHASPQAFRQWLASDAGTDASEEAHERKIRDMVQDAAKREGWNFDFSMLDEAHEELDRRGKPNSRLANVMDGFTEPHRFHINATATAVKNDVSEAWDLLHKLRPDRYPLSKQGEFMRKYGGSNIGAVSEALRREAAPYMYAQQVDTGVRRDNQVRSVDLTPAQKERYRTIHQAYLKARRSQRGTPEWLSSISKLFPKAQWDGYSDTEKAAAADRASRFLSSRRDAMLRRVVFGHDDELKPDDIAGFHEIEAIARKHSHEDFDGGQLPGIVFAHNPGVVKRLRDHLRSKGYRVGTIDGTNTTDETDNARNGFFPQGMWDPSDPKGSTAAMRGKAKFDILLCSDAASHGLNLHRAGWLAHVDPPYTAKTHQQRNGRADRIGSLHGDIHFYDLSHQAPVAQRMEQILQGKYPITGTFQQPYELLDQDGTGTVGDITHERDANLSAATNATIPGFAMPEASKPMAPKVQQALDQVPAAQEYAAQEAAGQTGMF